jgi:hypothetical protein
MPVIVLLLAILFNMKSLLFLAAGVQGLTALGIISFLWITRKKHVKNDVREPEYIRFGYHASAAGLLGWIAFADRLIIHEQLSAADLAIYSVAMIFPAQTKTLYTVVGQFIGPDIAEANGVADAWRKTRFKIYIFCAAFLIVGIVGFFAVQSLIPLLFSSRYASAAPYGKWLFLVYCSCVPAAYFGNILRAQRKKTFYYGYEIIQPVATIFLYSVLIRYGLEGMTYAQILRQIIFGAAMVFSFVYYLRKDQATEVAG